MKYLMLLYGESENMNSETLTTKIAKELQPVTMSDQIKFIYGEGNAIFHFDSELNFAEMTIYCDILIEEFGDFMYVLIPFNGVLSSNAGDDRIKHLLDVKTDKKRSNEIDINFENVSVNDAEAFEMFIHMTNSSTFAGQIKVEKESCSMSLDELLDKMIDQGIDSLTDIEKQKLEEYSK